MEQQLYRLAKEYSGQSISDYFVQQPERFNQLSLSTCDLMLDYSKQNIDSVVLGHLVAWAKEQGLTAKINAMFNGDKINNTENRAVLHTVLRAPYAIKQQVLGDKLASEVHSTHQRMAQIINSIQSGVAKGYSGKAFTDVVAVGIGGSYYGPKVCHEALKSYRQPGLKIHYLANVDGTAVVGKLEKINLETTLVVIISKTFVTQETILNANVLKQCLLEQGCGVDDLPKHFVAVTAAPEKAQAFGVDSKNILPMWDWVGGRFSLWSAVGFPLACAIGVENFEQLCAGAYEMDQHFQTSPFENNMPVLLALIGIWNCSFLGHNSLAVLPYDHLLRDFPGYLQQVDMESSGKRVDINGDDITMAIAPIVFGQEGTNGQHAFMQLMHQRHVIPTEFIVSLKGQSPFTEHHRVLVANCFAQSEALMQGKDLKQAYDECIASGINEQTARQLAPHKVMPGNSPSSTLVIEQLTPKTMGSLMALYEHKIFVQGAMWNLNSFDQWGVELGKQLGETIINAFDGKSTQSLSGSSKALVDMFLKAN